MFVRFARFEGSDASNRDARVQQVRQDIEAVKAGGAPEGAPPEAAQALRASVKRVMMLVDERDGTEGAAVFCATEEDLQRADQVLNAMSLAQGDGRRSDVAHYEVVLDIEM